MYGWLLPGIFRMSFEDAVIDHPCMEAWMNRMHFLCAFHIDIIDAWCFPVFFFELYMECGWNLGKLNRCFWKRTTDWFWKKSSPPVNWRTKSCSFCLQICMEGHFFSLEFFFPRPYMCGSPMTSNDACRGTWPQRTAPDSLLLPDPVSKSRANYNDQTAE